MNNYSNVIDKLKGELDRGFTKRQLEELMELPLNCLSGIINEKKKVSKLSMLKMERYFSWKDRPDALEYHKRKKERSAVDHIERKYLVKVEDAYEAPDPSNKGAYLKWLKEQ